YRFCEINGLEWMSENYNYEYNPGVGSLYYGYADRSVIKAGHAIETDEDRKLYGRLYDWPSAMAAAPEGWRLPTELEVDDMIISLGGNLYAEPKIKVGGETGFDLNFPGMFSRYGSDPAYRNVFDLMDKIGYYWTSDYSEDTGFVGVYYVGDELEGVGGGGINGASTIVYLPVRYVRDVQK
ncbi:MAG: fibrobacter succinogenes major paralogous domain-containing protein, partial [Bacteroidales bacterium]|nr:fibrobacter succinogenes major paralogous domain-containing protein [Bacteroidales bacterium]